MSLAVRSVSNAISWGIEGVAVLFFLCVALGAVALLGRTSLEVPHVFSAAEGLTNGAASLRFDPDRTGMLALVLAAAVLGAVAGWRRKATVRP